MSQKLANTGFYDATMFDDRNERALMIAFVTIVTSWALAFAVAVLSAHVGV